MERVRDYFILDASVTVVAAAAEKNNWGRVCIIILIELSIIPEQL